MNISSHHQNTSGRRASTRASRRGGFTLVEILMVLVIASIITGIVISGFSSLSASNRRTNCQTNMTQIYSALRLYSADEGSFPYYGGKDHDMQTKGSGNRGIGLWALYTFPDAAVAYGSDSLGAAKDDNNSRNVKPIETYLRKVGAFHCPSDIDPTHNSMFGTVAGGVTQYNENYLSYQAADPDSGEQTYKTTRVDGIPTSVEDTRQLLTYVDTNAATKPTVRTPPTNTVVFWCPWHRKESNKRDVVLFLDGSIQSIDQRQDDPTNPTGPPLEDWHRKPQPTQ